MDIDLSLYGDKMKLLAMYLPQFHRVPENDRWWGEGFTDWISAKKANQMFEGHYQPHVPLNKNYYDILDKSIMAWQAELMKKYGVDGMCIYHYWFKDGKKILERPAENLLEWTDIDMPFCFYWANETWARSWSQLKNVNVWLNKNCESTNVELDGILLRQQYGSEKEWSEHFSYLFRFFSDFRYIRVNEKPLFLIYKADDIDCIDDMLDYWRMLAEKNGLGGLYIIGAHSSAKSMHSLDAVLYHEPSYSRREFLEFKAENSVVRINYDAIWNRILQNTSSEIRTYYGGFTGYDDTPRKGQNGIVVEGATPKLFGDYLTELMAKNAAEGNDIVFINAWNEWGEGMHLEPDEKYGFAFLEQISHSKAEFFKKVNKYKERTSIDKYITYLKRRSDKFEIYLNLMDRWMLLRESGRNLSDFLIKRNIKTVLIYGYGILGRHLLNELSGSDVSVVGFIDMQKDKIDAIVPIFSPSDTLPRSDAVIVASCFFYPEIKQNFSKKLAPLLSIETLINESFS